MASKVIRLLILCLRLHFAGISQQDSNTRRSARDESALQIMTRRVTEIELQHKKLLAAHHEQVQGRVVGDGVRHRSRRGYDGLHAV